MIYLEKNKINKIVLTLNENTTISNPYYIFKFINKFSNDITYFYTPDISTAIFRYNLFYIELNDIAILFQDGNDVPINLSSGQYDYYIYQSTTLTFVESNLGTIIETGRAIVKFDNNYDTLQNTNNIYK